MKPQKRILALLLAAMMTAPALVACSETGSTETESAAAAEVPETIEAVEKEPELSEEVKLLMEIRDLLKK